MLKKILVFSLLMIGMLMSGCGNNDGICPIQSSEANKRCQAVTQEDCTTVLQDGQPNFVTGFCYWDLTCSKCLFQEGSAPADSM